MLNDGGNSMNEKVARALYIAGNITGRAVAALLSFTSDTAFEEGAQDGIFGKREENPGQPQGGGLGALAAQILGARAAAGMPCDCPLCTAEWEEHAKSLN